MLLTSCSIYVTIASVLAMEPTGIPIGLSFRPDHPTDIAKRRVVFGSFNKHGAPLHRVVKHANPKDPTFRRRDHWDAIEARDIHDS